MSLVIDLNKINSYSAEDTINKRILWVQSHSKREEFLSSLRAEGKKGKAYSDAVVAYDKENMKVF